MINAGSAGALKEIKRITTDVAVLIDSERASEGEALAKDREAFKGMRRPRIQRSRA